MELRPGDLTDVRVIALLEHHAATAWEQTAVGSAHALDLQAFASPHLSLWSIWSPDELLGIGALKRLSPSLGEIKAMHTTQAARRQGVGSMILRHLIGVDGKRVLRASAWRQDRGRFSSLPGRSTETMASSSVILSETTRSIRTACS